MMARGWRIATASLQRVKAERRTAKFRRGHRDLRRGHYELAVDQPVQRHVAVAFGELATARDTTDRASPLDYRQRNSAF
jgi:hypothetical protein